MAGADEAVTGAGSTDDEPPQATARSSVQGRMDARDMGANLPEMEK